MVKRDNYTPGKRDVPLKTGWSRQTAVPSPMDELHVGGGGGGGGGGEFI